jgi:hypothetical protein
MNVSKESLEMMKEVSMLQGSIHLPVWGLKIIGFLGFLIYTKRHFAGST